MSAPDSVVADICRDASSAWEATCALLDLADSQGMERSVWEGSDDEYEAAESVRKSLERFLHPPGETDQTVDPTYDPTSVGDAIAAISSPLSVGQLAYVVATVLDQQYWVYFTRDWLENRGSIFDLDPGDRYPIGDMCLKGADDYSARPHRLGLPPGELAHVRRRGTEGIRVIVNGDFAPVIDGLMGSLPIQVAALLPNESWSELVILPDSIGPADAATQQATIVELLEQANRSGVDVAVLPELSVDSGIVEFLSQKWAEATNQPIVFAGSSHFVDGGRRVNRTAVLLPGVGVAWSHDKFSVFVDQDGNREPIDLDEPCITLGCGHVVRIATLICKDALNPSAARLMADLGVHLLAVPAMSDRLGDFTGIAHQLISRSQGAAVVANNPRLWEDNEVEHALLGHPVQQPSRQVDVRRSRSAPNLGIARLGTGWMP